MHKAEHPHKIRKIRYYDEKITIKFRLFLYALYYIMSIRKHMEQENSNGRFQQMCLVGQRRRVSAAEMTVLFLQGENLRLLFFCIMGNDSSCYNGVYTFEEERT